MPKHTYQLPITDGAVTVHGKCTDIGTSSDGSPVVVVDIDITATRKASSRVPALSGNATARQFATLLKGASVERINVAYGPQYAGSGGQGPSSAYRWYLAMAARAAIAGAGSSFPAAAVARLASEGASVAMVLNPKRDRAKACIGTPKAARAWAAKQLPRERKPKAKAEAPEAE